MADANFWSRMTNLLSKSTFLVERFSPQKFIDLEHLIKTCKDVISKGKEKLVKATQKSNTPITQEFAQKQSVFHSWKPQLHNFQSTLKQNASKISLQLSYRSNIGISPLFRDNLFWRKARKGHLIAFAGLFLFQEEHQKSINNLNNQYQVYENVCKNIQAFFPTFKEKPVLPVDCGHDAENYKLEDVVMQNNNIALYSAQIKLDEDDITLCSECSDDSSSWFAHGEIPIPKAIAFQHDFAVKVVGPGNGVQKLETIMKEHEHELLCGGIDLKGCENKVTSSSSMQLPPHPNIMKIERVFCGNLPSAFQNLSGSLVSPRTDQGLYIVAKRYKYTLSSYLKRHNFNTEDKMLVLVQLFEAVAHLNAHNIIHRDISGDNVFIEMDDGGFPRVVLSGFDKSYCAASRNDMKIPFQHACLDTRVGDLSSQAPEVSKAKSGRFRKVDYRKSDAWMAGCVAYHVLTGRNPFTDTDNNGFVLDSRTYQESDLPSLPDAKVSEVVKAVVKMLLCLNPAKRLSTSEAADILHLELFALPPCDSLNDAVKCEELTAWLSMHCAEAIARKYEGSVPFEICQNFFTRFQSKNFEYSFRFWMAAKRAQNIAYAA